MQLRAERLVKRYRFSGLRALDGVTCEFAPGQIVAILGSNGAGKTTLLSALSGNLVLDEGEVFMDGQPFTPDRSDLRRRFAFIPAVPRPPAHWTPLRLIGTLLKLYRVVDDSIHRRVWELLEQMDLVEIARWPFHQLSRGQAYKAVLAGFLAADPELWLIDEPFASGMDPCGLNCFKEYARAAPGRGRTIIFTTQIMELVEQFADRVCVLDHGVATMFADPAQFAQAKESAGLSFDLGGEAHP